MLNQFMDKQLLACNLLMKDIENKCVTHAYLIDENNYSESFDFVLSFVKEIICDGNCIDNGHICKRMDDGNYPELKIISADGLYIKKQQIIDLQQEFSRSSVEGNKRIYIIRDCEKMRTEAANSMLKFLEEPEDNIVAILMTNNINNVLSTIISRCKIVKLASSINDINEIEESLENLAIDFVNILETKGVDTILSVKDVWFSVVSSKERDKMIVVFDRMIDIYYDIMKVLTGSLNIKCSKWKEKIMELSKLNKLECILKKIDVLIEAKESIKFNVNSNLLIDSVIVSIGGMTNGSRY